MHRDSLQVHLDAPGRSGFDHTQLPPMLVASQAQLDDPRNMSCTYIYIRKGFEAAWDAPKLPCAELDICER